MFACLPRVQDVVDFREKIAKFGEERMKLIASRGSAPKSTSKEMGGESITGSVDAPLATCLCAEVALYCQPGLRPRS